MELTSVDRLVVEGGSADAGLVLAVRLPQFRIVVGLQGIFVAASGKYEINGEKWTRTKIVQTK